MTGITVFFFNNTPTPEIYTLSLHDALPICLVAQHQVAGLHVAVHDAVVVRELQRARDRSEEHTSELQSRRDLVCRLLLEKKKSNTKPGTDTDAKTSASLRFYHR